MSNDALAAIVGNSPAVRELRALISRVAPLELPIVIQGPTGAGKELVAQALHAASGRPGRCVAVNVCAIADSMFEDALFGHVRGAFTGATADSPGYLAEAHQGTLFLDEIGGLGLPLQAKLLRVIETREFRPVGGIRDRRSDFRVVAATNEPIDALVATGRFRADFAHRLSGVVITVPPLRDRLEDIPELVRHFMRLLAGSTPIQVTDGALRALQEHDWPGNVRELRHTLERALALSGRRVIGRSEILHALRGAGRFQCFDAGASARSRLLEALEACAWDTALVALRFGVHRTTIYRRMRRYGIPVPRLAAGSAEPGWNARLDRVEAP